MPKPKSSLGRALIKQKAKEKQNHMANIKAQFYHQENDNIQIDQTNAKLKSMVEQSELNDFIYKTQLDGKATGVEQIPQEKQEEVLQSIVVENKRKEVVMADNTQYLKNLRIPRRPLWLEGVSAEDQKQKENTSFLLWRKQLAQIEEDNYQVHLTPYEKNIEVWRQLWRVTEKSDILIQIVDGRDPLFYHCADLDSYSKEVNSQKITVLLINKSDLMSDEIRTIWHEYFMKKGITHMFFSALNEQEKHLKQKEQQEKEQQFQQDLPQENTEKQQIQPEVKPQEGIEEKQKQYFNQNKIISADELFEIFDHYSLQLNKKPITIGMVGYPNVGKSSLINTLCQKKVVGVAPQPGKTKHFQTHFLTQNILLCDCPGLVFPTVAATKAHLVINGVLPIDTIKDHLSPVDILAHYIPKSVFSKLYHVEFDNTKLTASKLLSAIALARGYFNGSALPDEFKVSKQLLKDYVTGKLLHCQLPPNYDNEEKKIWTSNTNFPVDTKIDEQVIDDKDNEQDDAQLFKKDQQEQIEKAKLIDSLTPDEVIDLTEGKKVHGLKLNKHQRREIKNAIDREDPIDLKSYFIEEKGKIHIQSNKKK